MPSAAEVAEFSQANRALVQFAQRDLEDFWQIIIRTGDPWMMRDALLSFFPDLVTDYGTTSAVISADWFDATRNVSPSAASFRAAVTAPSSLAQAEGSVRWAVGPLFDPEPDLAGTLARMMGATHRLVRQPGRDAFWDSSMSDPVRTGAMVVPQGAVTCKFCIMLASRGAVYKNTTFAVQGRGADSSIALNEDGNRREGYVGGVGGGVKARGRREVGKPKFHDDCDCEMVAVRSPADIPENYNREFYERLYREGSGVGREIPQGGVLDLSTR